jgi:hypothetical protein
MPTSEQIEEAQKKAQEQVERTSGGRQIGGTYAGQQPDAATTSTVKGKGDRTDKNQDGN